MEPEEPEEPKELVPPSEPADIVSARMVGDNGKALRKEVSESSPRHLSHTANSVQHLSCAV